MENNQKKSQQKKPALILIGMSVILLGIIVFLLIFIRNKYNNYEDKNYNYSDKYNNYGENYNNFGDNLYEKNIKYVNGDYSYCPNIDQINYDYNENVMYFNNLLIVYTYTDLNESEIKRLTNIVGGTLVGDISGIINALQIEVKESSLEELNKMANELMQNENVLFAGYDYPIQMSNTALSSDPWSQDPKSPNSDIGNENNPGGNDWWAEAIGAYTAWENLNELPKIKVGIIDSGFDADHEDLNGKISFLDNYKTNSEDDHGTHIAGLIGAISDNEKGIRGIVDSVDLVCVDWSPITNNNKDNRYVNYLSTGEYIEITKSLIEHGVRVINNSWGNEILSKETFTKELYSESDNSTTESNRKISKSKFLLQYFAVHETGAYDSYMDCIKVYAKRTGLESMLVLIELLLNNKDDFIVVQGAGNGYDDGGKGYTAENAGFFCAINNDLYNMLSEEALSRLPKEKITYKAIKDHIFIVGAVENQLIDGSYKMTGFSNFGASIDICAPGKEIFSTIINNNYEAESGTSMAAPIVAGCVALVWANDLSLNASEVKNIILNSCDKKAVGVGDDAGTKYPMINIGNAILAQKAETLYKDYLLSNNVKLIDTSRFSFLNKNKNGIFSAVIKDFDNNGLDEMLTFSLTSNASSQEEITIDLYCIEQRKVVKKQSSEPIFASYAGNGDSQICAVYDEGLLRLYRESCSFGGSSISSEFLTYKVQDNSLILCEDYLRGEFYRYDSYTYEEEVSGTEYSTSEELYAAVKKSGFDHNNHMHGIYNISNATSNELESLKTNHIFTFVNGEAFSEPGRYGFIFDNSIIKDILPLVEVDSVEKADIYSILLNNTWENNIQSYNEYIFKDNGELVENPGQFEKVLKYELSGDTLTIIWESGYKTVLKYVTKKDNLDWQKDLFFYNTVYGDLDETEGFFYEIDYEPDEMGLNNAMWLRVK